MPLVIPPDVTRAELCEAITNLREMQKRAELEVYRAELQVEIDSCLDKMNARPCMIHTS